MAENWGLVWVLISEIQILSLKCEETSKSCLNSITKQFLLVNGKIWIFFLDPDGDSDRSQNLMGSKLDQDPSSDFFHEDPTSSICVILLTNKQLNNWS